MKVFSKVTMIAFLSAALSILLLIQASYCEYIPKWSCDFENGLCHWLQAKDDQLDFKYVTGRNVGWNDHTTGSSNGKFLYLYKRGRYMAANIMSPILRPNNGSCKMVFHYQMLRQFHDALHVSVNMVTKDTFSGKIHRKLLFLSTTATYWTRRDVTLQSNVEFQVEVSGGLDDNSAGKIGIDDIWFTSDCQTNEKSPIRLIKLWSSPSHNYPAGVFYKNVNGSWSAVCSEESARSACNLLGLKDVLIGSSHTSYAHLKSGESFCLPNNITAPTSETCNSSSSCTNVTYWECKQDYISICPKLTHVACTSAVKYPVCVSNNQMCDYYPNCPGKEDESDCLSYNRCDFQKDMCDWTTAKHTLYEWKRYYDSRDKQYNIEVATSHSNKNGNAKLKFKYLIQGMRNSTCSIRFTYETSGRLRVLIEDNGRTRTVWSVETVSSSWQRAYVELPQNASVRLLFDATINQYYSRHGIFSLANVSFSKDCVFANHTHGYSRNDSSIFVCHSGDVVNKNVVCDFKVDCFDGSDEWNCSSLPDRCNFDSSFCTWKVGTNAPEKLQRRRGRTPSSYTGPSKDHTNKFKSGYYVYLEASGRTKGAFGSLISRTMQRSLTKKCTFRWFYHMWGGYSYGMGKLSIIYNDLQTHSERILWQVKGNQGDVWKFGSVTFYVTSLLYEIIIKAERGSSYRSDIAIDDVSFAPECFQFQYKAPLTITKSGYCPAVKHTVNRLTASIFQIGNGGAFCTLSIRTDPTFRISLNAEFFSTNSNKKVLITAGVNGSVVYGGEFSGSLKPFSLISSTNTVTIRVPPMSGIGSHAFTFNITSTDQLAHAVIYHKPSGSKRIDVVRDCKGSIARFSFASRGTVGPRMQRVFYSFPSVYYRNERCIFNFMASNGYRIKFSFTQFYTGNKEECEYGTVDTSALHIQPFRFRSLAGTSSLRGRPMLPTENMKMFTIVIEMIPVIRISTQLLIMTEPRHDYVQILNYGTIGQTVFSGRLRPFQFVSKRSHVQMLFVSDHSVQRSGFSLSVMATDENAVAPDISTFFSTTPTYSPWFSSTSYPGFLRETCSVRMGSSYVKGDYLFGEIEFDNTKAHVVGPCSWEGKVTAGSKYLLEFQHINTGSVMRHLKLIYDFGKSKYFNNVVNVGSLDLFEASIQFQITIYFDTYNSVKVRMKYSKSPGCYDDDLRTYYSYSPLAGSNCYCKGYKYGFKDSGGDCYCGRHPPAYYGLFMSDSSYCSNCRINCGYGKLYPYTSEYNQYLSEKDTVKDTGKTSNTIIVSIVTVSLGLLAICTVAYVYWHRKHRSHRPSVRTTPRDQAGNQRNTGPSVYFVNAPPAEGMLPSYEDATKDRLFFFNTLNDSQNGIQPGIRDAPPSFADAMQDSTNDRPPQYTEIAENMNQTRTGMMSVQKSSDPDLIVAMPDIESPERPISRDGRPASRSESENSSFPSMASLRSSSPAGLRDPLIVEPVSTSDRARPQRFSAVGGNRLEESRRNGVSRGIDRTEVPTRRNRNRATDLPPIQRVRAYDNRGADMTI